MAALSYNQNYCSTAAGAPVPYGFHLPNEQINTPETYNIGWKFGKSSPENESQTSNANGCFIQKRSEELCHAIQVPEEDMPIYWRPVCSI